MSVGSATGESASSVARGRAAGQDGGRRFVHPAAVGALTILVAVAYCVWPALHARFYQRNANIEATASAVAAVPSGVIIAAVGYLGPHLSARDTVLLWVADETLSAKAAPWVVADVRTPQYTFTSATEQKQHLAPLERRGYEVVYERDGYLVLHPAGLVDNLSSREAVG